MSEQDIITKSLSVAPPVATAPKSNSDLLLEAIVRRESRAALKEEAELAAQEAKDKNRTENAKSHNQDRLLRQIRCTHLKGGKHGPRSQVRDYAVFLHSYINGEQVIKCFICGMRWKKLDTAESLVRDGRKIPNHTKKGWADAQSMLTQSTNQPSSSEIPMNATYAGNAAGPAPLPEAYEAQ